MKHLTFFSKPWMYLAIGLFLTNIPLHAQTLVTSVEAETGVRTGGVIISSSAAGYSGTGYVTNFRNSSDMITVTVTVPSKALYSISVRYRSPQYKEQYFFVNSVSGNNLVLQPSSTFTDADAGKFLLNAGNNTITVQSYWGYSDIDKFSIYTIPANNYNITPNLVDTNATAETKALYNYLLSNFQKKIISGQTSGFYDSCKILSGRSPIIRGFDMQHYTRGYSYLWANGGFSFGWDDSHESENAINWYNQTGKKGIVAFQWHWHSPTGGQVGKNTFYTQYTTFDASKAVVPGNQEYTDIIRDIDSIATQLKKFQKANIPVIFRPLHEASGNGAVDGSGAWFWWGAKGASICRKLYNIIYDRITNHHGIHNLIWAWSSMETAWYPGNDSIDIVGYDSYPGNYNYTTQKKYFDILYGLTSGNKLIALTENGPVPNPGDCMASDAPWSYFMSWDNLLRAQNSKQHIIDVYNDSTVLILEPSKPAKPSGPAKMCINPTDQIYTTRKMDGVTSCLWRIFPSAAGVVSGTDTFCTVNFSNTYSGAAKVVVNGKNSIGTGQTSDTLYITITNVPAKPGKPSGLYKFDSAPGTQIYSSSSLGATTFNWSLIPDSAGTTTSNWILRPDSVGTPAGSVTKDTITFSNTYNGIAKLIVLGQNSCGSSLTSDTLTINIGLPKKPAKPVGLSSLCKDPADQEYYTSKTEKADSYAWSIIPSNAGTLTGTDTAVMVNFDNSFTGNAKLVVNGQNAVGLGLTSDTLTISIADVPVKAGIPAGATTLPINPATQIYTTTGASGSVSYIWKVTPDTAGVMAGTGVKDTINFSDSYMGTVGLVVVGQNACGIGAFSDTLKITIAKTNGNAVISQNDEFQVYPNPASQKVYAMVKSNIGDYTLELINANGITVYKSENSKPGKNEINASNLPQGIYVLYLKSNSVILKEKILITK